jgi:hypothetical protein
VTPAAKAAPPGRSALVAAVLAGWSAWAGAAPADRPCAASLRAPAAHASTADRPCHCRALGGNASLCSCRAGGSGDDNWRWTLQRPGQPPLSWPDEVSAPMGAAAFGATPVDLDADGRPELLVLRTLAESNGRGVQLQRLCVVPGAGGAPACREVTDWGWITRLVAEPGRAGCSLMQASWQPGEEPGRGEGTYAVGRLQRWNSRDWQAVPEAERPAPARRLLARFERERARVQGSPQAPLWWQHPDTRPACPGPLCPP